MFDRRSFLGNASITAVTVAALVPAFARAAAAASPDDMQILNSALELERAAVKAYDDAAATKLLTPTVLAVALQFRADHILHASALEQAVHTSGVAVSSGTAKIVYPTLASQHDVVAFALQLERKAAATYLSVVPDLKDRDLAGVAASILGVETTHVSVLANALGNDRPFPSAFGG